MALTFANSAWLMAALPGLVGLTLLPLMRRWFSPYWLLLIVTFAELLFFGLLLQCDFPLDGSPLLTKIIPWVSNLGLNLHLAIDRLNYPFVLLTTLMFFLCAIYSTIHPRKNAALFVGSFLVLETTLLGAFLAYDLLLFYILWEALLIPMALIIGVYGGKMRISAAIKFLLFTVFGSLPMLLAIVKLYLSQHAHGGDLSLPSLMNIHIPYETQLFLMLALFLAFAVKLPLVPVHSWLPLAHVEAPTEGSVILAAILLKLGGYGLIRFGLPIFPEVTLQSLTLLSPFAIVGVIYASLLCLMQKHVKKLIAYSSVAHMGMVALGVLSVTTSGIQGSIYQMLNHGITTGALFFLVGMLYYRSDKQEIDDFSGLAAITPKLAFFFLIATFSSIGLPGLNSFIGEFLILFGLFHSKVNPQGVILAVIAVTAVVLGAAYLLWLYRRIFFGPLKEGLAATFSDLKPAETAILIPLIILMFVLGLAPAKVLKFFEPSTIALMRTMNHHDRISSR